jgi:hypothetical protein
MDTETTGAEQEAPTGPDRMPPTVLTSTTNLIRFQREQIIYGIWGHEFLNSNRTRTITQDMAE